MRSDVPNPEKQLAGELTLERKVVVKCVRRSEILWNHAQVWPDLELSEINVGSACCRRGVGKLVGNREAAGDIMERVRKGRIKAVFTARRIRNSKAVKSERCDTQVLEIEFFFSAIEIQTKSAANRSLSTAAKQAATPAGSVRET